MNAACGLPVFGVGEEDAGAIDVLDGAAGVLERGGDDVEGLFGLLGDVAFVRADGAGAGDMDVVADADGAGEADDGLVGRCAGDVGALVGLLMREMIVDGDAESGMIAASER